MHQLTACYIFVPIVSMYQCVNASKGNNAKVAIGLAIAIALVTTSDYDRTI